MSLAIYGRQGKALVTLMIALDLVILLDSRLGKKNDDLVGYPVEGFWELPAEDQQVVSPENGRSGQVLISVPGEQRWVDVIYYDPFIDPIDLATASADELMFLPGVGKGIATSIVRVRDRYRDCQNLEWLLTIPGINAGKLETIKPLVKHSPQPALDWND